MTDYELGFARGEEAAWKGRGHPLPQVPESIENEVARGFWEARLPRNPTWARQRRLVAAKWDVDRERYLAKEAA